MIYQDLWPVTKFVMGLTRTWMILTRIVMVSTNVFATEKNMREDWPTFMAYNQIRYGNDKFSDDIA